MTIAMIMVIIKKLIVNTSKKWVCYIKGMITLILVQENNNCKQ